MVCIAVQGGFTMIQKDILPLEEELVISAAQFTQPVVLFLTSVRWGKNKTSQEKLSLWEGESQTAWSSAPGEKKEKWHN